MTTGHEKSLYKPKVVPEGVATGATGGFHSTNYVIRESTLRNSAAPHRRLYPLSEAFEVSFKATLHVVEGNAVSFLVPSPTPSVLEALEPPYQRRPHGVIEGDAGSGVATQVVHEGANGAHDLLHGLVSVFLPTSARNLPEVAVSGSRGMMVGYDA